VLDIDGVSAVFERRHQALIDACQYPFSRCKSMPSNGGRHCFGQSHHSWSVHSNGWKCRIKARQLFSVRILLHKQPLGNAHRPNRLFTRQIRLSTVGKKLCQLNNRRMMVRFNGSHVESLLPDQLVYSEIEHERLHKAEHAQALRIARIAHDA
jgi:hypothetical protein